MDIQEQIEQLEVLRNAYEAVLDVEDANSRNAIQAFHTWHTAAVEFFAEVLGEEDPLLEKFQPEGLGGNGYVLQNVYHSILGTYTLLKVKVKEPSKNRQNDIWQIMHPEIIRIINRASSRDSMQMQWCLHSKRLT